MRHYTAHRDEDGRFYVHDPWGRRLAVPYPSREAAEGHAEALTRDRWLLVVVQKQERSRSPWDAYVKFFRHLGDGRSAEERLLDWWLALPDRAYTRTRARVRVFDISEREWSLLAPGDAGGVLDPLWPDPSDPSLAVSFSPDAVRDHFEGTEHNERVGRLLDSELGAAARNVVFTTDELWALFDQLCLDVLEQAEAVRGGDGP